MHHFEEFDGKYKTPLDFLQQEWHEQKRMVQNHIGRHTKERGMADVGTPSLIEARDCLVECKGNINAAIALCARRREEKVGMCTWRGGGMSCTVYLCMCSCIPLCMQSHIGMTYRSGSLCLGRGGRCVKWMGKYHDSMMPSRSVSCLGAILRNVGRQQGSSPRTS